MTLSSQHLQIIAIMAFDELCKTVAVWCRACSWTGPRDAPENRLRQGGSKGQAREVPVQVLTPRKKVQPSTLVISVERRCGRSMSLSIRGSTWGVLLALALMAAAAWFVMGAR
jgi:hypothetical protein